MGAALFFLFALVCEIIGTLGGFGSSVLFVPLANFFFAASLVLSLTSILHVFSNTAKLWLFRKTISKHLFILYGIPSLLFTLLGAYLTKVYSFSYLEWALAIFLLLFSGLFLLFPKIQLKANNSTALVSGSLAGFMAGFTGTGGAIRGISLVAFNLEKNLFVGTSAAIDFGVDFSRMFIYYYNGFFEIDYMYYIPLLVIASFLGSYIGKQLLNKISQEVFKKIVLGLILLISISMLIKLSIITPL
ncbi:MAG: sulfite exporter TauE/SafE family protein [Sphingobacteriales bacterium]|nr:sulfite exporter TauE/SafE family protein [Sphingobacteriales bacterium]